MTMLPMKTGPGMASPSAGGMTQQQMGLLGLGIGLLSGNPRTQGLASGLQAYGQAYSPQAAMQRQMMQMQMEELQRQQKLQKDYENLILGFPQGGAAAQAAQPSMVEPALGGSLVDVPGGGVEPGQVQTAMMPPPRPAGTMALPAGVTPEFMMALGPERGMAFLAQQYKPQTPQKPFSTIGQLIADRNAGRISEADFEREMAIRSRPQTQINMPKQVSETQQTINAIREARANYAETGNEDQRRLADRLEMNLAFGGKPPESYIKARQSIGAAREGISEVYDLISRGEADPTNPKDRANVAQSLNKARLAYADILNRGANFTESEQAMIDSLLGGDPNDIINRTLRGDQSYLDALRDSAEALERRGQGLLESYMTPGLGQFQYSWEREQPKRSNEDLEKAFDEDPSNLTMEELQELDRRYSQ